MRLEEYQLLAARTINNENTTQQQEKHAMFGMVSEIGELNGIYQKVYQGHEMDYNHAISELGDLLWFIAEYCTSLNVSLDYVCQQNINKLKKRYPEGFDADHSLHRAEDDI